MATLQELRNSLTTVIVRYCIQNKKSPLILNEQALLTSILTKSSEDMITELDTFILESTKENETRCSLLHYLLNGIKQINLFLDYDEPASEDSTLILQNQLVQLIIDVQRLLKTPQSAIVQVSYNGNEQALNGLLRGPLRGYSFCNSGSILHETLLPALNLSTDTNRETITGTIAGMIQIQAQTIENNYLKQENHQLKTALESLQAKNIELQQAVNAKQTVTSTQPLKTGSQPSGWFEEEIGDILVGLGFFSSPSANESRTTTVICQQPTATEFEPD